MKNRRSYFDTHWQNLPLVNTKGGYKSSEGATIILEMHLMETIFEVNQGKNVIAMLFCQLVLNYR